MSIHFSLRSVTFAATLLAAPAAFANCPDWQQNGAPLEYSSDQLWSAQRHDVLAGGSIDLMGCGTVPGAGHVAEAPDFTMLFAGNAAGRALEFRVEAECDTVLLVNDHLAEWHYSDDDTNQNPRLRIEAAIEGIYDIWVGTYGAELCPATLIVETF